MNTPPRSYIIAEAGVNHNGSAALARELIDAAKAAGADAVKFQTFRSGRLVSSRAEKADYQKRTTGAGSQQEMLAALELSPEIFRELARYAAAREIDFLSSAFDEQSLDLVVSLGVSRLKLGSGELTNGPMLLASARYGLPVILSTGMATIEEIRDALGLLACAYLMPGELPSALRRKAAYDSENGRKALQGRVTLLHCTTEYPCPMNEVDLKAMGALRREFGLPVGYSDHTEGIAVSLAAAALGATVIEKHMTMDRSLPGPDHRASISPSEFAALVSGVRAIEMALGREEKFVHSAELKNAGVARRSLVAQRAIAKGEEFSLDNLTSKRPGTGISPMHLWDLLGRKASRAYEADALIDSSEIHL